ncbi:MAG: tRNA 4-thiouridine(8) synthase ThiI [Syntrophobacteraceae bacterium]
MKKIKGIGLLSGGLDSMLAVKVLQEQGLELLGLTFVTPFFGPGPGMEAGVKTGIEMLALDISEAHLEMLKKPKYGYGNYMNPCIDCHGLMLREACKLMEKEGADFLFTGEVLGQRPMSQRRDSLRSVEKLSGCPGRILRPLSAKLLPPTAVEEEGLVDRNLLLDIQGRSRKRQKELAAKYGITDYPQPGGGCMLTNEGFSNRLKRLLLMYPDAAVRDVEIIKWGRAFMISDKTICMVGRNLSDNNKLESLARPGIFVLHPIDNPGPICFMLSADGAPDLQSAASLAASYSDARENATVRVQWKHMGETGICVVDVKNRSSFKEMLL